MQEVKGKESTFSSLTSAVAAGNVEDVLQLLKTGKNPNQLDGNGISPLGLAIRLRQVEIVRLLISAGADPNLPDKSGTFPYEHAQKMGDTKIIEIIRNRITKVVNS